MLRGDFHETVSPVRELFGVNRLWRWRLPIHRYAPREWQFSCHDDVMKTLSLGSLWIATGKSFLFMRKQISRSSNFCRPILGTPEIICVCPNGASKHARTTNSGLCCRRTLPVPRGSYSAFGMAISTT